ncbi:MAG: glutamate 5-kinase [Coriobacteriales bacterium]|nr:glutamate 5-kinase [Coriobacteriales bacterium]
MSRPNRVVIKVGSSTLAGESGGVDRAYVRDLVEQVARLREAGTQVVLVSSGAIAAGLERLELGERPTDMPSLQAAASVGQVALVETYAVLFGEKGLAVGQVLLTRHDTGHREAYLHARDTVERLLALGAVPIVNENDTVAVDEIRFGDNDTLAALVATMVGADLVVLLSDIEGMYDADPRTAKGATLLKCIDELTADHLAAAGGSGSDIGSGGMATKLEAARVLMRAGIPMVICDGRRENVVVDCVEGKTVGTAFAGGESTLGARTLWIALGRKPAGEIVIDDGARQALVTGGKSLLPAGVVQVSGSFRAGDAVVLMDRSGAVVARGLSELSSAELDRVKGMKSVQVAEVLGTTASTEAVHRDKLVIL